jgi:hypothetical protein
MSEWMRISHDIHNTRRLDKCKVKGCKKKTLNYTGIVMTNPEHIRKSYIIMERDNIDDITLFNNCKKCWKKLMEEVE